jgi:hypothetical protein
MTLALCVALAALAPTAYRDRFPLPTTQFGDGWGVNIHFTNPGDGELRQIREGGFRWVRMDLAWAGVERTKGVYDFTEFDILTEACKREGVRILFILDYGNDLYQQGSPSTQEARDAFCRFAEAAFRRYKGQGILWEMWNEPNLGMFWKPTPNVDDYVALTDQVAETLRRVAPEEWFCGPATSGFDWKFLEGCFQRGVLRHFDAVTVHPYRPVNPETAWEDWATLAGMVARHQPKGKKIPLVSGEWGYSAIWQGFNAELQALYGVRSYLLNLTAGVPLSIYYDWKNDGTDPKEPEHHFGTVDHELKPKALYTHATQLLRRLRGYLFVARLASSDPNAWVLAFRNGNRLRFVCWTTGPGEVESPAPWERDMKVRLLPRPFVYELVRPNAVSKMLLELKAVPTILTVTDAASVNALRKQLEALKPAGSVLQPIPELAYRPDQELVQATVRYRREGATLTIPVQVVQAFPVRLEMRLRNGKPNLRLQNPGRLTGRLEVVLQAVPKGASGGEKLLRVAISDLATASRPEGLDVPLTEGLDLRQPFDLLVRTGNQVWGRMESVRLIDLGDPADLFNTGQIQVLPDGDNTVAARLLVEAVRGLRVRYQFDKGWKFLRAATFGKLAENLPGKPVSLTMEVSGDGSGNHLRARFVGSDGQTFQSHYGSMDWTGPRTITFSLRGPLPSWGGKADGVIRYPIRLDSLILVDSATQQAQSGDIVVKEPVVLSQDR